MDFEETRLGESTGALEIDTSAQHRAATVALLRQARRSVEVVSRHLDAAVYDQREVLEAARRMVLASNRARIRILVQDPGPMVRDGHRLHLLATRLPTFIELRVPSPDFKSFNQAFLVADETGYIHRELADRYEGLVDFHDPGRARELRRLFDKIWETAEPDPDLRSLRI
jgi:hypothetical protein